MSDDNGVYEFVGKINNTSKNNGTYYATIDVRRVTVSPYGINYIPHSYMFVSETSAHVLPIGDDSGVYKLTTHLVLSDAGCVIHYDKKPYSIEHYIKSGYECLMDKERLEIDNTCMALKFGDVVFEIGLTDITRNGREVKSMNLDNVMLLGEAIYKFLMCQKEIIAHIAFMESCA
ncbi:hypothetical protein E24_00145 [Faustovirus]|nr:hypothetical protein PRJ_Fausto_00130 [Faustovirus]AMN83076.1 hypothetical protein E24_00145 [Faustovirus]AMN84059.1 hypothetical protein D5a_00144 [Faustovirus]AMN85045.1 hypothetical protein E23_00144 [Faustovirus]QBR99044.1 hypothetical protein [Faustovirus mariensis]